MRTDHRPWPVPTSPWVMKQVWHNLLFAHWPVDAEILKPFVPAPLALDTYQGQAWIGVVPFHLSGLRLRYLPPMPFTSTFAEINVRTYVTIDEKPGVLFLSLDASNVLAVKAARILYRLPYYYADISIKKEDNRIHYFSRRHRTDKANQTFEFVGTYRPSSSRFHAEIGTLEYWLTERYCLYTSHKNRLYRCDILHEPWNLQLAEGQINKNTMFDTEGLKVSRCSPVMHFSEQQEVIMWGLAAVR